MSISIMQHETLLDGVVRCSTCTPLATMQVFTLERWLQIFWRLIAIDDAENQDFNVSKTAARQLKHDIQAASILHQVRHLVRIRLVNQVWCPPRHLTRQRRAGRCCWN
jgi:hypothetical protein